MTGKTKVCRVSSTAVVMAEDLAEVIEGATAVAGEDKLHLIFLTY